MEKQQINRQEITHSLYSAGFISCLIKRLLEAYEAYDYKLADLRKIGIDLRKILFKSIHQKKCRSKKT